MREDSKVHQSLAGVMRKELNRGRKYKRIKDFCAVSCIQCELYPTYVYSEDQERPTVVGQGNGSYVVGIYNEDIEICIWQFAISLLVMERDSMNPGYLNANIDKEDHLICDSSIIQDSREYYDLISVFVQGAA